MHLISAYIDFFAENKLQELLAIIAKSVPFKPNMTSIASALSASRNNITDYWTGIFEYYTTLAVWVIFFIQARPVKHYQAKQSLGRV